MRLPIRLIVPLLALTFVTAGPLAGGLAAPDERTPALLAQGGQPDRPNRIWKRASSGNFVAVGDTPEEVLREALTELEVFRSAMFGLSSVLPRPTFSRRTPLLVLFRSEAAFNPFRPLDADGRRRGNVEGYYVGDLTGAYMATYTTGPRLGDRLRVVLHEYAHDIFHATLGPYLPLWLSEGLAELAGSVGAGANSQITGRYLGRPLDASVHALRAAGGPSVAAMLETDGFELQAMSANEAGLFYAKAWALVHYLLLERPDRHPDDVPAFLAALERGESAAAAFESAFRVEVATMDATIARYMRQLSFPAIRIEDAASTRTMTVEPMLESDVDRLRGQLFLRLPDLERADEALARASARNPDAPPTRVAIARLRLLEHRPAEAIDLLAPLVSSGSADAVAFVTLGRARQRTHQFEEAFEAFGTATALEANDDTHAEAWFGRSLAALSAGMAAEAAEAMATLQKLMPMTSWYFARARGLWAAGLDAPAIEDVRIVIDSQGASDSDRSYAAFVGALAARRLGQPDVADDLLTKAEPHAGPEWTRTVLAYLQGTLSDRDFLSKADGRGEETEAHTYIGLVASLDGRPDEARTHLQWACDRGSRTYTEHDMACVELARIGPSSE